MKLNEQKIFEVDDLKIYINGYSVVGGQSEHGFPHFDVKKNNKTIACYFIPKMSEFLTTRKIKHFKEGMLDTKTEKKICSILSKKIQLINDEGETEDDDLGEF